MPSRRLLPASLIVLACAASSALAQSSEQPAEPPVTGSLPEAAPPRAEAPRSRMPGIYVTPVPPLRTPPAESRAPTEPHEGGCQYTPRKLDLLV